VLEDVGDEAIAEIRQFIVHAKKPDGVLYP
jgi:hypothetical protein